jgi:hypothetical protein
MGIHADHWRARLVGTALRIILAAGSLVAQELGQWSFADGGKDWTAGRLEGLATDYTLWRSVILYLTGRYGPDVASGACAARSRIPTGSMASRMRTPAGWRGR